GAPAGRRAPAGLVRLRPRASSPTGEGGAGRLLERDARPPADGALDSFGASAERRNVGRTEPLGIRTDLDAARRRLREQEAQHALDGPVDARAEVVHLARRSPLEEIPVAAHDVADVGESARRLEVADLHDRLLQRELDGGDLLREAGRREVRAATGAIVIECARPDDVEAVALEVLKPHQILRDLADR